MKLAAIVAGWEGLRGSNCKRHSANIGGLPSTAKA